jgi:5-methylcytosine-specific restriction endonuclease McrA
MDENNLSRRHNQCQCGKQKLKRSLKCLACNRQTGNTYSVKPYEIKSVDGRCLVCKFELFSNQKAFCCHACRHTYSRIPERNCICCGNTYKPKTSKTKYCGSECANKHKAKMYRLPSSKVQQAKVTVNGVKIGATCKLSFDKCRVCNGPRATLSPKTGLYCSGKCQRQYYYQLDCKRGKRKRKSGLSVCAWCGAKQYLAKHASKLFCSAKCSSRKAKCERRHRKRATSYSVGISWKTAVERFGWACAGCGVICIRPLGFNNPIEATLDHIVPISNGGSHTWDNVQILCRDCNTAKCDLDWQVFKNRALTR